MALQTAEAMGYASPKTIRSVISHFRDHGLPPQLTIDSIQRIGVTESLAPRTIQTLKLLGLIDEEGKVTEQFEDLRRAPTAEFKPKLVSILRSAYSSVFEVVEPSGASYEQVQDAFRTFKPEGQRDRMVALFLGLLEYAEYSSDLPSGRAVAGTRAPTGGHTTTPISRPKKDKASEPRSNVNRQPPPSPPPAWNAPPGEPVVVEFGAAGTVRIYADMRWMQLPVEKMGALRKAIEDIRVLGDKDSAPQSAEAVGDKETKGAVS